MRTATASWTAIEAPLDCSGTSRGEERAPAALRRAGLLQRVGADARIETDSKIRTSDRDPQTGVIGADEIRRASRAIGAAVGEVLAQGRRPLVVGGDCTLLLGVYLGLPPGVRLWFIDGHADFLDGGSSPTGETADMDLAILTGHGPKELLGAPGPLVDPAYVVLLGHRPDHLGPDVASENARIDPAIRAQTAQEIRERGAESVGQEIAAEEPSRPTWLHVDLDVLDERALPAVTYPQPLGLDWDEFVALARPLAGGEGVLGVSVADFNPDLDPDGESARRVVDTLATVLT
ncbi:MAG TPA: arginase family protein [Actinomycetota bacterium]|nr:arginase family protein [Actinomycetota bacterium]